jgi:uncharacterized protein (DUF3820 family)
VDSAILVKLANTRIPFGKYQDRPLMDLPLAYLLWFARQGFPKGELGQLLQLMLEINQNGTRSLLIPLKNDQSRT